MGCLGPLVSVLAALVCVVGPEPLVFVMVPFVVFPGSWPPGFYPATLIFLICLRLWRTMNRWQFCMDLTVLGLLPKSL